MDEAGQGDRSEQEGVSLRAARIQDVAKLAEVSTATVSRALATPERVSPEARARVQEAIAKTGYVPNPAARSLRSQKTGMVLVVLPDLANTFFSKILRGIEETLFEAGYGMIISDLDGSPEKEAHFAAFTAAGRVDGAILLNGHLFGQTREGEGKPARITIPLVALCEAIPGADIPQIEIDNRAAAARMTQHLASLGHRSIAYVSGPADQYPGARALSGLSRTGWRLPACRSIPTWSFRGITRSHPALRPVRTCWRDPAVRAPSSAPATRWPSASCAPFSPPGCACPTISPWPVSTISSSRQWRSRP